MGASPATGAGVYQSAGGGKTPLRRILYIEDAPAVGGSAVCLDELARGLDRSRFEPFVLFAYDLAARAGFESAAVRTATEAGIRGAPEPVPPEERESRVPAYKKREAYRLLWSIKEYALHERERAGRLARWIARERFDLVHANNSLTGNLTAIEAGSRAGVPVVSHQRGYVRPTAFQRRLVRGVDRILCVSRSMADYYAAQGFRRDRIVAVYDGIDVASLRPRGRAPRDRALVGWAGRLVAWKGPSLLVDAAETVCSRRPDADFVIAGAGPELDALRGRVERSTLLKDRLRLPGFRSDVRDLMAGCDVFVNTSIEPEPLSHSTLEAMALGVPIVAPRCGGFPELVAHGTSGLLFEPGRAASLADALERLIGDAPLRARFGAEGRRRAEEIFGLERHVATIEAVYEEVVREWSGRRGACAVTKP